MNTQEIIQFYLEQDVLISPDVVQELSDKSPVSATNMSLPIITPFIVLNKDSIQAVLRGVPLNVSDFEHALVLKEKHHNDKIYAQFQTYIQEHILNPPQHSNDKQTTDSNISTSYKQSFAKSSSLPSDVANDIQKDSENNSTNTAQDSETHKFVHNTHTEEIRIASGEIVDATPLTVEQDLERFRDAFLKEHRIRIAFDYTEKSKKRSVMDFVNHLITRYKDLEKILRTRQELQNLISIGRLAGKKDRENVAIVGYVYEKALTKKGNILLTLEDPTGHIKVVVNSAKEDLKKLVDEIQLDEVIGVTGLYDGLIFANNIIIPDIPLTKELKKSPEEGYFVVITDPQVGNKLFLEKEFNKFLAWINGTAGSDAQRAIAKKVKYVFLVGDLVDGVGIYPDQEFDLNIIDVHDQYKKCAEYLRMIPNHMPIFVCPGNHDVGRISDPQPRLHDEYSKPVWEIPNVISVSSPSIINIFAQPEHGFDGFDVLLYHGYSFVYYSYNLPSVRQKGGQKRPDLVMKYLLQRRHLAPTHTSTLYVPDVKRDPLTLNTVPDFFFSGHIHRSAVLNYRNVTCINASCWVAKSEEQERRGLEPQPARAFIINMQTREVKVMNFLSKEDQEKEAKEQNESVAIEGVET